MNGLNYKGISSKSFGLNMKSENRGLLPTVTRQTISVPKRMGVVDFENDTYGEKEITVLLSGIYNNSVEAMQASEQISAWLYNDGKYHDLIFDDQPDRIYKAKIATKIDVAPSKSVTIQVSFICNPPFPYVNGILLTPENIIWNNADLDGNQYYKSFDANSSIKLTVNGTTSVKPKIKLINYIQSGLKLAYNSTEWQFNDNIYYDGILIDCEAETVTKLSDGSNLYPFVNPLKDTYFELEVGQVEIAVTGVTGAYPQNLIILIEFQGVVM